MENNTMLQEEKEEIRKNILEFLEQEPGYLEKKEDLKIFSDGKYWIILYGEDLLNGTTGFGGTVSEVIDDFKNAWKYYYNEQYKMENFERNEVHNKREISYEYFKKKIELTDEEVEDQLHT